MEALSIGCRNKHWLLIILSNFNFINIPQYAQPLWCRLPWTQEQPVPQRPGILRDNQLMKSKFDKMFSVYFCSLCWVPPYQTCFLNFGLEYLTYFLNQTPKLRIVTTHQLIADGTDSEFVPSIVTTHTTILLAVTMISTWQHSNIPE